MDAEPMYMDKDLFKELIGEVRRAGFRYAGITGLGEILLHPQLEDIFLLLAEHNIDFEILTNGYLFKERLLPILKSPLIRERINIIGFSLDSSEEEIHDKNRKEGSFRKIIEAIGYLRLLEIPFYIKTAVTNINKDRLKEILLFTSGLGASQQSFIFIQPTEKMIIEGILPEPEEIYRIFMKLCSWFNMFPKLKVEGFNPFNDLFSCNAFYKFGFDEQGNYLICNNLSNVGRGRNYKGMECIGNIKEHSIEDLVIRHMKMLPGILRWRFKRKDMILKAPLSLCNWCYKQFGKLEWLKNYPDSGWARCLNVISTD